MMEIRKATLADLDQILEIEDYSFKVPWKRSDIEYDLVKNPVNVFLVGVVDNIVVAFLNFMITFNSASIVQIATKKEERGKNFATSLLNEMFNLLPKDGEEKVEFVTLEVRESNKIAFSLYSKLGFECGKKKPHYYPDGEDAIYMFKRM